MYPYLLLDSEKCVRNIELMITKTNESSVFFRPHFKTHQSAEIGTWFLKRGISGITVSSLKMAEYFSDHAWKDICIATPINILETDSINDLATKTALNILVESLEAVRILNHKIQNTIGIFIKIDTGYNRTGIAVENPEYIHQILTELKNNKLVFKGFVSHFGNTYQAKSKGEINSVYNSSVQKLLKLKSQFIMDYPDLKISIGDTPSCSIAKDFSRVDEIRPGNFVFFDVMQWKLGSCSFEDIAVALIAPVLAKHPERNEIVVHGGAVHLSKEFILNEKGERVYGLVSCFTDGKWSHPIEDAFVSSLSQEHGIVKMTSNEITKFQIGDLLAIIPIHSCLTANLMRSYRTKEGRIIEMMP